MSIKSARESFQAVYEGIKSQASPHHFEFSDPFWVLITTMMSHRTKDEVTDAAARSLFNRYRDAGGLSRAEYDDVLELISKVGFKTVKAKRIIDAANIIMNDFGGEVPGTMEELTTIPGVGRKTANVVLADAMGKPAIAVDTHVQRISNRLGWSDSKNPDETEEVLKKIIPEEYWLGFNPMLVEFGKKVCKPIGPRCGDCSISGYCKFYRDSQKKASRASATRGGKKVSK